MDHLLTRGNTGAGVWADPAYRSEEIEARLRALQLGVYRLAWSRLTGTALDHVRAAFYYADSGETVWPDLLDEAELTDLVAGLSGRVS